MSTLNWVYYRIVSTREGDLSWNRGTVVKGLSRSQVEAVLVSKNSKSSDILSQACKASGRPDDGLRHRLSSEIT